jgi:hypothetical protein
MARTMTLPHGITTEQVRKAEQKMPALHLVRRGADIIGMVEKYRDSRTDKHPHKAIMGTGCDASFVEAFYGKDGFADAVRTIAALSLA